MQCRKAMAQKALMWRRAKHRGLRQQALTFTHIYSGRCRSPDRGRTTKRRARSAATQPWYRGCDTGSPARAGQRRQARPTRTSSCHTQRQLSCPFRAETIRPAIPGLRRCAPCPSLCVSCPCRGSESTAMATPPQMWVEDRTSYLSPRCLARRNTMPFGL